MQRIHVIGRKNHGKTRLVVELVEEFRRAGLRVGTIKHTHHRHELDTPGKDSHRHRAAGAAAVGVLTHSLSAIFLPAEPPGEGADRYAALAAAFAECDLVIVEGDAQTHAPKIEVWRAAVGTPPLAAEDRSILAVVSDDPLGIAGEIVADVFSRSAVPRLANWILETALQIAPAGIGAQ